MFTPFRGQTRDAKKITYYMGGPCSSLWYLYSSFDINHVPAKLHGATSTVPLLEILL